MAKKCIPGGGLCIENMTLFLIILLLLFCVFFLMITIRSAPVDYRRQTNIVNNNSDYVESGIPSIISLAKNDVFSDPYFPPLKDNVGGGIYPSNMANIQVVRRGVPINIETRPTGSSFNQVGILTRGGNINGELILPVFGRNLYSNSNKWQYYTLSNTGNISSKLPIRVHGKDAMSEYGVDEIFNGDVIYVQGYNDIFLATIYDSRGLSYIPYL
jgi:hypothetical protein